MSQKDLSLFHSALLEHLGSDKTALSLSENSNSEEVLKFQESLKGAARSGDIDGIIGQYHTLFEKKTDPFLEKKLLDTFAGQIKIYRGLPRLYRSDNPTKSYVKDGFTDLPALRRIGAENFVLACYENYPIPKNAKICFFTQILPDGWGDYIAGKEAIALVMEKFPHLPISWVLLVPEKKSLPEAPKKCKIHTISYEGQCPLSSLSKAAKEALTAADLILQIPTYYPHTLELCKSLNIVCRSIGEYGFLETNFFNPKSGNRSMGLHFLEKGILIRKNPPKTASFKELESKQLVQWLFSQEDPGPKEEELYRSKQAFYLAYLNTPAGGSVYLQALLKAHEKDQKGIDICTPDVSWLIQLIQERRGQNLPLLETSLESLDLYYDGTIHSLVSKGVGKKVRIFCPGRLSQDDFRALVSLSGEFVAVTGNQSFSEVISAGKVFFYDGRNHARYFLKDLIALAENRLMAYGRALQIFRGMGKTHLYNVNIEESDWVDETYFQENEPLDKIALKIGAALRDPDCAVAFKTLGKILSEEHSFNRYFLSFVQRELCHRFHPEIAKEEEMLVEPFAVGKVSLAHFRSDLKIWSPFG
jgi:hypothetical protein